MITDESGKRGDVGQLMFGGRRCQGKIFVSTAGG